MVLIVVEETNGGGLVVAELKEPALGGTKAGGVVLLDLPQLSPAVLEPPIRLFLLHRQMAVCSVVPSCLLPTDLSLLFCVVL